MARSAAAANPSASKAVRANSSTGRRQAATAVAITSEARSNSGEAASAAYLASIRARIRAWMRSQSGPWRWRSLRTRAAAPVAAAAAGSTAVGVARGDEHRRDAEVSAVLEEIVAKWRPRPRSLGERCQRVIDAASGGRRGGAQAVGAARPRNKRSLPQPRTPAVRLGAGRARWGGARPRRVKPAPEARRGGRCRRCGSRPAGAGAARGRGTPGRAGRRTASPRPR